MFPPPVVSLAATELGPLQRGKSGASCGRTEGVGRDIGIVEGWGSDEDEDVNIDSDEKDSGSEGQPQAEGNAILQGVPTPDSLQLDNSLGMLERTETLSDLARNEDQAGIHKRHVPLREVCFPIVANECNGLGGHTAKEEEHVGNVEGENLENVNNATPHRGVRLGSSSEGSALEGGAKRLDARRFRRDFNVKLDNIFTRMGTAVPDAGLTRGSIRSDAKDGKKLRKEKELPGGMGKNYSTSQAHGRNTAQTSGKIRATDSYGKAKRNFREQNSKQGKPVLKRSMQVRHGELVNEDCSKRRRLDDVDFAQALERKSSLRVRRELSNLNEGRSVRKTRSYADTAPFAKSRRVRKDELSESGTSGSEKQILSTRGLVKAVESPVCSVTKAGRQELALDNKNQDPPQAEGYRRKTFAIIEGPHHCLSGDFTKMSYSGEGEALDSLEKVFERRPTKRQDTRNASGGNLESKRVSRLPAVAGDLLDGSGGVCEAFYQKIGEKELRMSTGRRSTRRTGSGQGPMKAQLNGIRSDESQSRNSKEWQDEESGGWKLQHRPARNERKEKEVNNRGHALVLTESATAQNTITIEDGVMIHPSIFDGIQHLATNPISRIELAGAEKIKPFQAEKLKGKSKQSSEQEMENDRRLSPGDIKHGTDFDVGEGTEQEKFDMDRTAKSTTQTSTREKCIAIAHADVKIGVASVDRPLQDALPRHVCGWNEKILEEGEIETSDFDGKQEVDTVGELPRETSGVGRLGASQSGVIYEGSKSVTMPAVQRSEQNLSQILLGGGQSQAAVEEVDSKERIFLSEKVYANTEAHFSHASTIAGGEKSQDVTFAGRVKLEKARMFSECARHEDDGNYSVQAEVDELDFPEDCPAATVKGIGREGVGELLSPPADKFKTYETSELQAGSELREDRSDSEDGRLSDRHNSYCQYCRQGGELLCCDGSGCKITYHLECTDPRLLEVPSGNWYCPKCSQKRLSHGVHAIAKSVESIWDVRNRAQSSDQCELLKDIPVNSLDGFYVESPWRRGRSLVSAAGTRLENVDRLEDESVDAVTCDDGEELLGIAEAKSAPQGGERKIDEDKSLRERRLWDADSKETEKRRTIEGETIVGGTSTAIHCLKLGDEFGDKEYFVKWKGLSHAHNTWLGEADVAKLSPKVLAGFRRKLAVGQAVPWNSDWAEPQRLVDKRVSIPPRRPCGGRGRGFVGMDAQQEWLVKWKSQGYEHCTWEPVNKGALSHPNVKRIEIMFERWSEAARYRSDSQLVDESDKMREASFKELRSQPEWIGFGKLLPYQLDRLNQLRHRWHHRQHTVLVDQNDQEKSSTTVTFLLSLIEEYKIHRLILVVVPVLEIQYWEAEMTEYAPQVNTVVYAGGKEARGIIQRFELKRSSTSPLGVQVVLTTSDVASTDFDYLSKFKWEVVVVDENQQLKTAKSHRPFLQFDTGFWLLFTSELSKYNMEELQQLLFLFEPQNSSIRSNVRLHLSGLNGSGQLKYLEDQLSEYLVRDNRQDSAPGLKLVEFWVGTNMTPLQIQLYCSTLTKNYNLLQSGRLRSDPDSPSLHDFVTQLRLCCQHPYLVDSTLEERGTEDLPACESLINAGVETSGKFQLIHAMLSVLHRHHHRVVILSQNLKQLFFLDDYLRFKYGKDSYELVDSRLSALQKISAVQKFNAKDSTRSFFLLKTGACGFTLKLKDNDIVIFHDSDLNPANDLDYLRKVLHRMDGEVKVFRLYQHFTVEEGSMVYDQHKKCEVDPKPLSVKILQQLLRWKVHHILKLDSSVSEKHTTPKGKHKADRNNKATQDLERVANILQGKFDRESVIVDCADELWAEMDGDSIKDFWFSLLKDRHAELQEHEDQSNAGKGLRQRKRVQYSEEALAMAPYSVLDEEFGPKRRKSELAEFLVSATQDRETQSSLLSHPSTPRPASSCLDKETVRDNALNLSAGFELGKRLSTEPEIGLAVPVTDLIAREQCLEPVGSDGVCKQDTENVVQKVLTKSLIKSVAKSVEKEGRLCHLPPGGALVSKHQKPAPAGSVSLTNSPLDSGKRLRMEQKQLLFRMEPELSQICDTLQVAESIACYSRQLLSHVMNNFRMPKEPRELVVMVEISLCLIASAHFREVAEHFPAISLVGEKMNLPFKKEEFESVYSRLEGMCLSYVAHSPALQDASGEGKLLNEGSSQPASTRNESSIQIPPTDKVRKPSPSANCDLHPAAAEHACIDLNPPLRKSAVPINRATLALIAKDDLPRTDHEQLHESIQPGTCKVTGFQDADPSTQAHSDEVAGARTFEANASAGRPRKQAMAASLENIQPPPWSVGAIRAKLKSDKDQILHSWLAKQKLEVQEFNVSCAHRRDAWQKSFEKQKTSIFATSAKMQQEGEIVQDLGDIYASTRKLCEHEQEDRRQVMNSAQRDLRDRINVLYTTLLQQVTTRKLPDLVSEARSMGLTFAMQAEPSELLDHGHIHTKNGQQVIQVRQSIQYSTPDQNTDVGSLPSDLRAPLHSWHQTQPKSRDATSPRTPNSETLFLTQPLPQHEARILPPVEYPPQLQYVELLRSSPPTSFPQTFCQEMLLNLDGVSAPEELVATHLPDFYLSPQRSQSDCLHQNDQAEERSHPSCSHLDVLESSCGGLGSEPVLALSDQGLDSPQVERGILQPRMTEHARVQELITLTQESLVAQTSQTMHSTRSQSVQIPHTTKSLQERLSPGVPYPQNVQPRVSQTVDALSSLRPRLSQLRRPPPIHHASRHPASIDHASAHHVRVQSQLQPTGGQGYASPSAYSSLGGTLLTIQTRSNVLSQSLPLGTHAVQGAFGPDPLAHEENRLKRQQEKLKLLYNEESTQIKTQYDKEATDLQKKYQGLLFERAQMFEQKTTALKESLEKVDRNRQLAEALKLRSFFDQQKARQNPSHGVELIQGSAHLGRLSGVTAHNSGPGRVSGSQQSNVMRNVSRSLGRGIVGAFPNADPGLLAVTDDGVPNRSADMGDEASHIASWHSSTPGNGQNLPSADLISGAPVCSALTNCSVPQSPWSSSSTSFVSSPESYPQTNSFSQSCSGPLLVRFERVLFQPDLTTASSMQQEIPLVLLHDGNEGLMVHSSGPRVEHLSSNRRNSEIVADLSTPPPPAISITTALNSPTVTEAVVVSVSPFSTLGREQGIISESGGDLFVQEQHYLSSTSVSANEVSDLFVPLGENQISTFETRVRNRALLEGELDGHRALSQGQKGLASSQSPTIGLNSSLPAVPVIYLSDDE